jgi:hypothetical protein
MRVRHPARRARRQSRRASQQARRVLPLRLRSPPRPRRRGRGRRDSGRPWPGGGPLTGLTARCLCTTRICRDSMARTPGSLSQWPGDGSSATRSTWRQARCAQPGPARARKCRQAPGCCGRAPSRVTATDRPSWQVGYFGAGPLMAYACTSARPAASAARSRSLNGSGGISGEGPRQNFKDP